MTVLPDCRVRVPQVDAQDPLRAKQALSERTIFYPLGFPLLIETDSEDVLRAAAESWSECRQVFDANPITLSIAVSRPTGELPQVPVLRSRNHLFSIISDSDNFIVCDFARGYHFGWVTQTAARDVPFFRYYFLEVAALTTIQQRYLAPVHGACVSRRGGGVLLCGESSAGKSTLAYACARAGWTYVSDDASFLVRAEAGPLVTGHCHSIRLREESRRFFPELARMEPTRRANGTLRLEIPTSKLSITAAPTCDVRHLVFLHRSVEKSGGASLVSSSGEEALEWCCNYIPFSDEAVRDEQVQCYRQLLALPVWRLSYRVLDEAVELLDGLVRRN